MGTHWLIEDVEAWRAALLAHPLLTTREVYDYLPEATRARHTLDQCNNKAGTMGLGNRAARVQEAAKQTYRTQLQQHRPDLLAREDDKKEGTLNWREFIEPMGKLQSLARKSSSSQDTAAITFPDATAPMAAIVFGDSHMGSFATDHDLLLQITDEILSIPDLFVILTNDLADMAINLRGVAEVHGDILPPDVQMHFLDSWMGEMAPRVLMAGWDNHSQTREERGSGVSMYRHVMSKHCIFHDGIGHVDLTVGHAEYRIAMSHRFRGSSMYDPCYGPARYLRMEAPDRELAVQGDLHVPGYRSWWEGGSWRTAVTSGSIQNSLYGRRHFSLKNAPIFPCINFRHDQHGLTIYKSVADWLAAREVQG